MNHTDTLEMPAPVTIRPLRIDVGGIQARAAADLKPFLKFYLVDDVGRTVTGARGCLYFSQDWRNVFFYRASVLNGFEGFATEEEAKTTLATFRDPAAFTVRNYPA